MTMFVHRQDSPHTADVLNVLTLTLREAGNHNITVQQMDMILQILRDITDTQISNPLAQVSIDQDETKPLEKMIWPQHSKR